MNCVEVEVAALGSPSLISLMISVDVKQHWTELAQTVHQLCESRGGRTGLPVPNNPYGPYGHKATLNWTSANRVQELRESRGGCAGLPVSNKPYDFCGRKANLERELAKDISQPTPVG